MSAIKSYGLSGVIEFGGGLGMDSTAAALDLCTYAYSASNTDTSQVLLNVVRFGGWL